VTEPFGPRRLTDILLEPVQVDDDLAALAGAIPRELAALAVPHTGGGSCRVTDHDVRTALSPARDLAAASPFTWNSRTARRSLGLAGVRALLSGEARNPSDGVRRAVAQAGGAHDGRYPTSSLDRWLSRLPPAGRAAVGSEAVTWATRLWTAVDWSAFPSPPIIGRDHWWDSPHSSLLALRGRAEVRTEAPGTAGGPLSVHLVVLGGARRPTARSELCVVGLVEALRAPRGLQPGRIVGWWPDSGHLVRVEMDGAALRQGTAAVSRALAVRGTDVTAVNRAEEAVA
jgi:hypothetical protein